MKNFRNLVLLSGIAFSAAGCDLLEVSDPTRVEDADLAQPVGIELLRVEAVTQLYDAVSQAAYHTGLVSDELFHIPSSFSMQNGSISADMLIDMRTLRGTDAERIATTVYDKWNNTRIAATHAINWYHLYGSAAQRPVFGQLLTVKGYATLSMGEQLCTGFPLHDVNWDRPVYSPPLTTTQVLEKALTLLDSAVVEASDNAEYASFARVTRARALLALGRIEEAGQAVADVPTTFVFNGEYGTGTTAKSNRMRRTFSSTGANSAVSDGEGINGIDFRSAADPRLPLTRLGVNHTGHEIFAATKYQQTNSPIAIATGIEARLIEAEAALAAGSTSWLDIINDLRATRVTPAMAPLEDPGTPDARLDLLFRERAIWLYGTGHRLGDLRRLVDHYGRAAETVFPTGDYLLGGLYSNGVSLPFSINGEDWAGTGVSGCRD